LLPARRPRAIFTHQQKKPRTIPGRMQEKQARDRGARQHHRALRRGLGPVQPTKQRLAFTVAARPGRPGRSLAQDRKSAADPAPPCHHRPTTATRLRVLAREQQALAKQPKLQQGEARARGRGSAALESPGQRGRPYHRVSRVAHDRNCEWPMEWLQALRPRRHAGPTRRRTRSMRVRARSFSSRRRFAE